MQQQTAGLFGLSRFHTRLLWVAGVGWMFDAMDVGLLSFVLPTLSRSWNLQGTEAGLVASFTFLGMFAGAAVAGSLSDRYGRKAVFQWTLILYAIGTGLSALAWDLPSLLAFRLLAGMGLGGELPVASTLVSEWSPPQTRGRMMVLLESFWAYGWIAAALIGLALVPNLPLDMGWRVAFALGALPALYVLYTRRALPESPRFLVSAGRSPEAAESVAEAARLAGDPAAVPSLESFAQAAPAASRADNWRALWQGALARRTAMLWILWFGMVFSYYGIFTWLPSIFARDFPLVRALEYNLVITIAQVPGYFTAAWLVERLGRRITLASFLAGSALGAFLFRSASGPTELVIYGCIISFFALGAWGVIYTYTPELYPTRIRGWGAGAAAAVGRIAGIFGPYVTASIVGTPASPEGVNIAFFMFTLIFLAIAANVVLLGEETKGRTLEEIADTSSRFKVQSSKLPQNLEL
jgi:MFS transporter, putative metabolite:H+ symporter